MRLIFFAGGMASGGFRAALHVFVEVPHPDEAVVIIHGEDADGNNRLTAFQLLANGDVQDARLIRQGWQS